MAFVIRIERVKELAKKVKAAFFKAHREALKDIRKIDTESKNEVNVEMTYSKRQAEK